MSQNYFKKFIVFNLVIFITILLLQNLSFMQKWISPFIWFMVLFLASINLFTHFIIERGLNKTAWDVNNAIMLSTTLKLLCSAIMIFIYFYKVKLYALESLINFFVLYFTYTFFEIKTLLLSLHPHSKSEKG